MRPITLNNNSPTGKLAKWLLRYYESMQIKFETAAMKNTTEIVGRIKDIVLMDGEIQVSFDVESLYPNLPIDDTLVLLEEWVIE